MEKFRFSVFLLIMTFSLVGAVSADHIESYDIVVNLVDVSAIVNYNIITDFSGNLEIMLPEDAKILEASEDYVFEESVLNVFVDKELNLEYLTREFVDEADKHYFLTDFPLSHNVMNFSLRVILPEGATLDDPNAVFPKPEITTDGVNIILNWEKNDIEAGGSFPVFMAFRVQESNSILVPILVVIAVFILLVLLVLNFRHKLKRKLKVKKVNKRAPEELHLIESESKVIGVLRKEGGEMWQKQIQIKTGFSKAKLSRIIRDLEVRKLIKRIPLGNTNKIKLI